MGMNGFGIPRLQSLPGKWSKQRTQSSGKSGWRQVNNNVSIYLWFLILMFEISL